MSNTIKKIRIAVPVALITFFGLTLGAFASFDIDNINVSSITATSAQIKWVTDTTSTNSYVTYGTTTGSTQHSLVSNQRCVSSIETIPDVTSFVNCIQLSDLRPSTTYYYKAISVSQLAATSVELHFSTPASPLSVLLPPTISASLYPGSVSPSVLISWGAVTGATNLKIIKSSPGTAQITIPVTALTPTSYIDRQVYGGIAYTYVVQSCDATRCSVSSLPATVQIPKPKPSIPTLFTAKPVIGDASQVNLTWVNLSNEQVKFEITRSISSALQLSTTTYGVTFLDKGLIPGTHIYSIKGCNDSGCSNTATSTITIPPAPVIIPALQQSRATTTTSVVSPTFVATTTTFATTTTLSQDVVIPEIPRNFRVIATSANSVQVMWQDTSFETFYKINRTVNNFSRVNTTDANTTSYSENNLNPGGYFYSIQACNGTLCSATVTASVTIIATTTSTTIAATSSKPVVATTTIVFNNSNTISPPVASSTTEEIQRPLAPISAYAAIERGTINAIRVNWKDTSSVNKNGYTILRSSTADTTEFKLTSTTSSYVDRNLRPGKYTYYIASCNEKGCSPSSVKTNEITISVLRTVTPTIVDTTAMLQISNAVRKLPPGTFVSIISTSEVSPKSFTATTLSDGTFRIQVPDGEYFVEGIMPARIITLQGGKVTSIKTKVITTSKIIQGSVVLSDGSPIMNAEVSAYKKETNERFSVTTDTLGKYSIKVSGGIWDVTVRAKDGLQTEWSPTQTPESVSFSSENINENKIVNLTVQPVTSSLTIQVKDEKGVGVPSIGITIDSISQSNALFNQNSVRKVFTGRTDGSGMYTAHNPPGSYFVRPILPDSTTYTDTTETPVTLSANNTKTIFINLKKRVIITNSSVSGVIKFDDGTVTDAFVSAWSNNGESVSVKASTTGVYTLSLATGQTWHIKASKDLNGQSYISDEQTFTPSESSKVIDLVFVKSDSADLPDQVAAKKSAQEEVVIASDNGAKFTLPANAVSSASGIIDVTIKPTGEASSQAVSTLVSTAYDITIKNSDGVHITKLATDAEIIIPYDKNELDAKGVTVNTVVPSYYDEVLQTWVSVPDFTINTVKKVFVLRVNHLTRFALIAAADTLAPSSPTNIVTDAITPTDVRITWQNPSNDFNHVKIYRSEKAGSVGNVIATEVFSNSFVDKTNSTGATSFYYTVRAVDAAGNESGNINQLAFTPNENLLAVVKKSPSFLLPPGQVISGEITRMLHIGSEGDDVVLLQKALKYDGFYATGPVTGYYGKKTENAVFRFQNYYKQELLIPNGYKIGTGVVGTITRKKINEIIAKSGE